MNILRTALHRNLERYYGDQKAAKQRLASQQNWEDRAPAADVVTHNDGTIEQLEQKVELEISQILSKHKTGTLPTSKYMSWYDKRI